MIYTIQVSNIGSQTVTGFAFDAAIPAELLAPSWTCVGSGGGVCTASGSGDVDDTLTLTRGHTVRYTVVATVDPSLDPLVEHAIEVTAVATVAPGIDINPDNNTATDVGLVLFGIFRDGFEAPPPPRTWSQEQGR